MNLVATPAENSPRPVAVANLRGATAISAGDDSACASLSNGAVKCWGNNGNGQLGDGNLGSSTTTPVPVAW